MFNSNEREQIYEELDGPSRGGNSKAFNVVSKVLSVAVLLSLGFASGSLYSTYHNGFNHSPELATKTPVIATSSTNGNVPTTYTLSHTDISGIVEKCANSVVEISIETQATLYGYYTYTAQGNGSGVIISSDGYIITNNHVIKGANNIKVRLRDGTEYDATLIGKDTKTDVAVIKIDAKNLTPVTIGDSSKLVVGEIAVAIGNPLGQLGGTVTDGIISALEREIRLDNTTMNLIQTNAAINPGNSGGGLFNANGDLIGIVVAKSSGIDVEGLGFAIPINDVKEVINDLVDKGYASNRAFLGVSLRDTSYSNNNGGYSMFSMFMQSVSYGAAVDEVLEGSAADKAGIQKDDIIVSIDNEVTSSSSDVTSKIAEYSVGDKVTLGIIRDRKTMNVEVTLGEYKGE